MAGTASDGALDASREGQTEAKETKVAKRNELGKRV